MFRQESRETSNCFDMSLLDAEQVLKHLMEKCNMNMDDVRNDMNRKERERILSKHKYAITEGKDGRWKTTVPDSSKTSGRRQIAKTNKEDLLDAIVQHYQNEGRTQENTVTLKDIYPEWLRYKGSMTDSSSYIKRLHVTWNKYYKDQDISMKPLTEITKLYLEQWAHYLLKSERMTEKAFYNTTIIIKQCLEYACEDGVNILQSNPWEKVKINKKMFVKQKKPKSKTQVYSHHEQKLLFGEARKRYQETPQCSTPLMIMLNFQLGLRIGELCALKYSDIDVNEDGRPVINIQRMETEQFEIDSKTGKTINKGYRILERVKSDAGDREIYLNTEALKIIEEVKALNDKYNRYDDGYLFMNSKNGKRTTTKAVSAYIARLCKEIGIEQKSNHKIRKTYTTNNQIAGVPLDTVRRALGHEDARTTLNSYLFDTSDNEELYAKFEAAAVRV